MSIHEFGYAQTVQADGLASADREPASCQPASAQWTETRASFPANQCVHQLFEAQVERTPDAVAVIFEDQQLTYQQLNQRANQLAHSLRALGVSSNVLVGIHVERCLEMIVGLLGVLKAGGAYVPLDPSLPADRLAFILADTQVPVILTQAKWVSSLPAAAQVCLDSDWDKIAQNSQENPICEATAHSLIYTIYTSGSTGQPKGVMITHLGICNQLYWRQTTFPLTEADRVLQNIPFSFDPSVWQIFWPLLFGAQLVLPRPGGHQDSAYLVNLIAQQQISVIALVPAMLRVLLEEQELDRCQNLRHVFCGGEALPLELQERFFARFNSQALHNVYGPTEASIDATFWTCEPGSQYLIAPIGRPIANTQTHILDANLQPVSFGKSGELHISGVGLARGYLNRPELTAEKFIPDPYSNDPTARLYKTGDLARYLPDGNIEFLGRIDHQVKVRGFRIELGEIETALSQHPAIRESVVVAREDWPGDKRLVAYLVAANPAINQPPTVNQLRAFLMAKLPEYMVPAAFVGLEALPLNPNGKVDRRALPAPSPERPDLEKPLVAAQDALELELTRIWQQVLNIQPIGVRDSFFELGGNSLLAAKLFAQIEATFNKKLLLSVLVQSPTIEQLAAHLRQEGHSPQIIQSKALVAIQPKGSKPPLFCVHSIVGNVLSYYPLVRYLGNEQPLYGLQTRVINGKYAPHAQIEQAAANYIQEIQAIQPVGPYFLSGYSFGGLIAYEMARQLQAQGQHVGMLALLDTYNAPAGWFKPLSFSTRCLKHLRELSKLDIKQKWLYIQENFLHRSAPTNPPGADALELQDLRTVYEQAMKNYRPQTYSGRVVLFRADPKQLEQAWSQPTIRDPLLGWGGLIEAVETYDIPCHHFDLLLDPFVGILSQQLQVCLDQAQSQARLA